MQDGSKDHGGAGYSSGGLKSPVYMVISISPFEALGLRIQEIKMHSNLTHLSQLVQNHLAEEHGCLGPIAMLFFLQNAVSPLNTARRVREML